MENLPEIDVIGEGVILIRIRFLIRHRDDAEGHRLVILISIEFGLEPTGNPSQDDETDHFPQEIMDLRVPRSL
ncbi:Hypothetical predicted protein [Paramuricea clavata]|uniref:Uncharacterized protein n=1 Tax=Paramuricea clavata TaxID=317549 RepID=A0A6S7GCB0_PARCT|nr:Hypothetical predicted protein [Paramuricea clavata]